MKKQKWILISSLILSACGVGNRGTANDPQSETNPNTLKGTAYFVGEKGSVSTEVREDELVVSSGGNLNFKRPGSSIVDSIYKSMATVQGNDVTEFGVKFYIVPAEVSLKKSETDQAEIFAGGNKISLGTFSIEDLGEDYKFKLNQESLGNITVTEFRSVTQYDPTYGVADTQKFETDVPMKSILKGKLVDGQNVALYVEIDPSEQDKFAAYQNMPELKTHSNLEHSLCTRFKWKETFLSNTSNFETNCHLDTGLCDRVPGSMTTEEQSSRLNISLFDHNPEATCLIHGSYGPFEQKTVKEVKLSIKSSLQGLFVVPKTVSDSANTKILFQDFDFSDRINFLK